MPKIKDNKAKDTVQIKPLAKLCFSFDYLTDNKTYCFHYLDIRNRLSAFEKLLEKLKELSQIDLMTAQERGKISGCEKIKYSDLYEPMQNICKGTGIVTNDSKVTVYRFCNQNYRLICKDDINHSNLQHVIAFDFDFSAYNHGG